MTMSEIKWFFETSFTVHLGPSRPIGIVVKRHLRCTSRGRQCLWPFGPLPRHGKYYSTVLYSGDNQLQALCNSTIGLQCHWQRERGEECILFSLCSSDPKVGGLMARHVCCPSVRGCRDVTSTDSDTPNTVTGNVPGNSHTGASPLPEPFWKWRKGNLCLECWNGLES